MSSSPDAEPLPIAPDFKPCLEGIVIDCTPNDPETPILDLGTVTLNIFGMLDDGDYSFPLERLSRTRWGYDDLITLPEEIPDLMITAQSEALGDMGYASFSGAELLHEAVSNSQIAISRVVSGGDDDTEIKLSFVVRPFNSNAKKEIAVQDFDENTKTSLMLTPERALVLSCKAIEDTTKPTSMDWSTAIIFTARWNAALTHPDDSKAIILVPDQAPCVEDIAISYIPDESDPTSASDNLHASLVIVGYPGKPHQRLPLKQLSKTTWKYEGFIQLPKVVPDMTMSVDINGALWDTPLNGAEFMEFHSKANGRDFKLTDSMDKNDSGVKGVVKISMVARSVLTRDTIVVSERTQQALTVSHSRSNLKRGVELLDNYIRTGDQADLDQSIACVREATLLLSTSSPQRGQALLGLSTGLRRRYGLLKRAEDLDEIISIYGEMVPLLAAGSDEDRALAVDVTKSFSVMLTERYDLTGNIEDLDRYILLHKQSAVDASDVRSAVNSWCNLGAALVRRFERLGDISDINESIDMQRTALELAPPGDKDRGWVLNTLGTTVYTRFKHTGDPEDLEQGILYLKEGLILSERDEEHLPMSLNNLGAALMRRFQRFGNIIDINEAIKHQQKAVQTVPTLGRYSYLNNLALSFQSLYSHTKDIEALQECIDTLRHAIQATPDGNPTLPMTLNNLAFALTMFFDRAPSLAYAQESMDAQRKALELLPSNHPFRVSTLDNLGVCYQNLFKLSQNLDDIDGAIDSHREAAECCHPDQHADLSIILSNIGGALRLRHYVTDSESDLEESIRTLERALDMIPDGHKAKSLHQEALARTYEVRYTKTREHSDVEKAIALYSAAALSISTAPMSRLEYARHWSRMVLEERDVERSQEALGVVVDLVALVAGMDQTVEQRYEHLATLSHQILNAASFAIVHQRLEKALEWLEQGRGLVWGQLSTLRMPMDKLKSHHPVLAEKFSLVCRRLEVAGGQEKPIGRLYASIDEKISLHDQAAAHVRLAKEREELLQTIRETVPGFENFLRPLPASALLENLPDTGPVVVISCHSVQSAAIVLLAGTDEPMFVALPDFSYCRAQDLCEILETELVKNGLGRRGMGADQTTEVRGMRRTGWKRPEEGLTPIEFVLQQLWLSVAKPIVESLALSSSQDEDPTRIWWCMTGPLTALPLHAAGIYRGDGAVALSDYAVSSYIPTLSSLAERVKSKREIPKDKSGLLMVSQPNAPDIPTIPGTTIELDRISQYLDDTTTRALRLDDEEALIETGLKAMEDYSCVHLACHATQHQGQPLRSSFYLSDGRLELSRIIKSHLTYADLAFLSACQTSTGSVDLSEESVHLAAGMLAAGYRGVVATMWSIQDNYAFELAEDFYRDLFERTRKGALAGNGIDGSHAAYSLHYAVQRLRKRHGDMKSFLGWVPYVHFGL